MKNIIPNNICIPYNLFTFTKNNRRAQGNFANIQIVEPLDGAFRL